VAIHLHHWLLPTKKSTLDEGFIYLFQAKDAVKLGFSTNVEQRLANLSRWPGELKVIATISGTVETEKTIHQKLQETGRYLGNEWYPLNRKTEIRSLLSDFVSHAN
jgi:hypothetical protein